MDLDTCDRGRDGAIASYVLVRQMVVRQGRRSITGFLPTEDLHATGHTYRIEDESPAALLRLRLAQTPSSGDLDLAAAIAASVAREVSTSSRTASSLMLMMRIEGVTNFVLEKEMRNVMRLDWSALGAAQTEGATGVFSRGGAGATAPVTNKMLEPRPPIVCQRGDKVRFFWSGAGDVRLYDMKSESNFMRCHFGEVAPEDDPPRRGPPPLDVALTTSRLSSSGLFHENLLSSAAISPAAAGAAEERPVLLAQQVLATSTAEGLQYVFSCARIGWHFFAAAPASGPAGTKPRGCRETPSGGPQRIRVHVMDLAKTAELRSRPGGTSSAPSLAMVMENFMIAALYRDGFATDEDASETMDRLRSLKEHAPLSCADWIREEENSKERCLAFASTSIGFVEGHRPTSALVLSGSIASPSGTGAGNNSSNGASSVVALRRKAFSQAKAHFDEALRQLPGFCAASAFKAEGYVRRGGDLQDQVGAALLFRVACVHCGNWSVAMFGVHEAWRQVGWALPCRSSIVGAVGKIFGKRSTR